VARAYNFVVKEGSVHPAESILPTLDAFASVEISRRSLKTSGAPGDRVSMQAVFTYPFSIGLFDEGNLSESDFIRELRNRLEAELVKVAPAVSITYRRDIMELE
jgi:hypothetical protein